MRWRSFRAGPGNGTGCHHGHAPGQQWPSGTYWLWTATRNPRALWISQEGIQRFV